MPDIDDNLMQEIVQRIVQTAHPLKVIVFGSRARGEARPESDLDLLIISRDSRPHAQRASDLYGVLSDIMFPVDIVVYPPREITEWQDVPQAFVTTAVRERTVLYENYG